MPRAKKTDDEPTEATIVEDTSTEAEAPSAAIEETAEAAVPAEITADTEPVEMPVEIAEAPDEGPKARPRAAAKAAPASRQARKKQEPAPVVTDGGRPRRKTRVGRVVSNKMKQTIVVAIESKVRHALYGKTIRRTTKFKAHDVKSECGPGDTVEIMETRPISKEKRWRVVRIVERAK